MILYGITQCDSVKKARKFLSQHDMTYTFFDLKKERITPEHIQKWLSHVSLDALFNKRSKTYRELSEQEKQASSPDEMVQLMCSYPTLIKRPVLEYGHALLIGFKDNEYEALLHEQ